MRVTAGPDIVISARNVTLTLGAKEARTEVLKGIDLDVGRHESIAILGPSGSGKSSLMAILSGLEQASGGDVRVAGIDYGPLDEDALALARRGRIGIVLQSFHLLPTMNALENVAVPMELAGMEDPFGRAEAELEAVGLGHRLGHYPAQLSGGEQQRVAIARAVAPRPDIIFADEPTGNLDGADRRRDHRPAVRAQGRGGGDDGDHHPRSGARGALRPDRRDAGRADRAGPRGMKPAPAGVSPGVWRGATCIAACCGLRLLFVCLFLGTRPWPRSAA